MIMGPLPAALGNASRIGYPDPTHFIGQTPETQLGDWRLIVRRTRLVGKQAELFPDWRHHAFATNQTGLLKLVEAGHREHAVVELAIRDLKDQALAHFPSGEFAANSALDGDRRPVAQPRTLDQPDRTANDTVQTARVRRQRLLRIPGRLTRTARQWTLRMPARWPWQTDFTAALTRIRKLPALT